MAIYCIVSDFDLIMCCVPMAVYKLFTVYSDGGTVCVQYVLSESGPVLLPQPPRWLPGKLAWLNSTVEDIT